MGDTKKIENTIAGFLVTNLDIPVFSILDITQDGAVPTVVTGSSEKLKLGLSALKLDYSNLAWDIENHENLFQKAAKSKQFQIAKTSADMNMFTPGMFLREEKIDITEKLPHIGKTLDIVRRLFWVGNVYIFPCYYENTLMAFICFGHQKILSQEMITIIDIMCHQLATRLYIDQNPDLVADKEMLLNKLDNQLSELSKDTSYTHDRL